MKPRAYVFRFRVRAEEPTRCAHCGAEMRPGALAFEPVDEPDRDQINEAFAPPCCSLACVRSACKAAGAVLVQP